MADGYRHNVEIASPNNVTKTPKAFLDKGENEGTNDISRRVDIGYGQAALSFMPREFLPADGARFIAPEYSLSGKILVDCQRNFASSV